MGNLKSQLKSSAQVLKKHYFIFVLVCIITMLLGGEFFETAQFIKTKILPEHSQTDNVITVYNVLQLWGEGDDEATIKTVDDLIKQFTANTEAGEVFGHSDGVFADIVNKITSGYFLVHLLILLTNIFNSRSIAAILVLIGAFLLLFAFWAFLQNMSVASSRRVFLEARCYPKVNFGRIRFFYRIGKWAHVAWVLAVTFWLKVLWNLTIVGGVIMHYSYFLVPYIIAENPTLTAREAIQLSSKMMKGHKWEFFLKELMFLPAPVLAFFTGGLTDVLFVNPYRTAFFCECYADIRKQAKEQKIEGTDALVDECLFALPESDTLDEAYSDLKNLTKPELNDKRLNKFTRFCVKWFGLTFWEGKAEREYEKQHAELAMAQGLIEQRNREIYPVRLCPFDETEKRGKKDSYPFMCHYSIWSLIIMFMIFSMIGWVWEVLVFIVQTGQLVNRGSMHGPWVPIYGTGGVLILLVLYRFRSKPFLEFLTAIVLCGTLEYGTSLVMEILNDGVRWWDYTGYFMNLGGRICAEGLLVFGLGGVATVYWIAPNLNGWLRKIDYKKITIVGSIFAVLFIIDLIYSLFVPNTGEGITFEPDSNSSVVESMESAWQLNNFTDSLTITSK